MMISRLITIAAALIMSTSLMAQNVNAKLNVSVTKLNYTEKNKSKTDGILDALADAMNDQTVTEQPGYVDAVRASVIQALGYVRRFTVSDGLQVPPTPETQLIFDGTINYITTITEWHTKDKNRRQEHYAKISVTLHKKRADTGELLDSEVFEVGRSGGSSYLWDNTRENAIKNGLSSLRRQIGRYYNIDYPLVARILERGAEKKDKQKEVYIDLGSTHGVYEGLHFDVYTIGKIGGKETRKQIARLKINEIEGDEVSLCKVTSGAKDLKTALDEQRELLIVSTD